MQHCVGKNEKGEKKHVFSTESFFNYLDIFDPAIIEFISTDLLNMNNI